MTGPTPATIENPKDKDVTIEKDYWSKIYTQVEVPAVPSQFCVLVSTEVPKLTPIVEFGCGNGRDSEYFSTQGFPVFGSDLCKEAISKNQDKAKNGAEFSVCDCTNQTDVKELIEKARKVSESSSTDHGNVVVYNRFFLHSIDDVQEEQFMTAVGQNLKQGDKLYMEFRSELDETLPKMYGKDHYRRYVVTSKFLDLLKKLGFEIQYQITGQGMAKYKDEDPFVSRIIASKTAE